MESIIWIIAFCIGNNNSTRGSIWKTIIESKSDFGEETSKNREAKEKKYPQKRETKNKCFKPRKRKTRDKPQRFWQRWNKNGRKLPRLGLEEASILKTTGSNPENGDKNDSRERKRNREFKSLKAKKFENRN